MTITTSRAVQTAMTPSRPEMNPRASSTGSTTTGATSSAGMLSPASAWSPNTTPGSSGCDPTSNRERHSFPFPFPLSRSRSKSPRPPPPSAATPPTNLASITIPDDSSTLGKSQTSPMLGLSFPSHMRQRSDGAMVSSAAATAAVWSPPPSPGSQRQNDTLFQKKHKYTGSSPGGYGRHSDDWLFGDISITQTAKELVTRGIGKKGEGRTESM